MKLPALRACLLPVLATLLLPPGAVARELEPPTVNFTMMPMTKGVVEGVDWRNSEMTLSHEHIYDVNLAPGTHTFGITSAMLLERAAPGDAIYLVTDRVDGKLVVVSLIGRHPE